MAEEAAKEEMAEEVVSKESDAEKSADKEIPEHTIQAQEHGWKDLDTYLEEGGDPDMWRGSKAFNQHYELRQDNKSKLAQMDKKLDDSINLFAENLTRQDEIHRKKLEDALAQARDDNDIERFEEVSKEIQATEKNTVSPGEPAVIKKFRSTIPELDFASDNFNKSYNASVEKAANERLIKLGEDYQRPPSELECLTILNEEAKAAQKDFPHLFTKRKPKTPPGQADAGKKILKKGDKLAKLDESGLKIYNHLRINNKPAAKIFLENSSDG